MDGPVTRLAWRAILMGWDPDLAGVKLDWNRDASMLKRWIGTWIISTRISCELGSSSNVAGFNLLLVCWVLFSLPCLITARATKKSIP